MLTPNSTSKIVLVLAQTMEYKKVGKYKKGFFKKFSTPKTLVERPFWGVQNDRFIGLK